jgi:hypothetical protein
VYPALCEDVYDVIVTVGAVVELNAKGGLPFLCLKNMVCVRCVKDSPFEIELTHVAKLRPKLEIAIQVVANAVGSFEKAG